MVFNALLCQRILSYVGESAFWVSFLCLEIHQIFDTLEIEASIFNKSHKYTVLLNKYMDAWIILIFLVLPTTE